MGTFEAADLLPWNLARLIFEEPNARKSPTYRLSWFRSVAGFFTVGVASIPYRSFSEVAFETLGKALLAASVGVLAVIVLVPIWLRWGRRRNGERPVLSDFKGPAISIGFTFSLCGTILFLYSRNDPGYLFNALPGVVAFLLVMYFVIFVPVGIVFAARSIFRVGELNPVIAPILATVIAFGILVFEFVVFDTKGMPAGLWATLGVGGFATATAIASIEISVICGNGARIRSVAAAALCAAAVASPFVLFSAFGGTQIAVLPVLAMVFVAWRLMRRRGVIDEVRGHLGGGY